MNRFLPQNVDERLHESCWLLDKFRLRSFCAMSQDTVCSLMSRATTTTHVEERESELELQRLDKRDEPGERSSERCPRVSGPAQVLLCRARDFIKGCFPGAGRQSRWTAAAATAQRSQVPAQKVCVEKASASPPGGAATGASANCPQ